MSPTGSVPVSAGAWPRAVPRQASMILLATLLLTVGALAPVPLARAAIAMPLALCAPGYAIVALAFGCSRCDGVIMAALSVLLSVAFYPLLCLLLYAAGVTLARPSLLAGTDLFLVALAVAIALRDRRSGTGCARATAGRAVQWMVARQMLAYVSGLALIVAALGVAHRLLPPPAPVPFTAFYLTGATQHAGSAIMATARRLTVSIGIANRTGRRQVYRLVPVLDGAGRWRAHTIAVAAGHTWNGRVAGPAPRDRCAHRLSIALQPHNGSATISTLDVWVRAAKGAASCQAR